MRVLTIYGSRSAMQAALRRMHLADNAMRASVLQTYTLQSIADPANVMQGIVITAPPDLEKLKGLQFDAVLEDASFDPGFALLMSEEAWRAAVRAYVLTR